MKCPKCIGLLEEREIENIKIDVCWSCEGIWFDAGELQKLIVADSKSLHTDSLGEPDFDGKEVSDIKDGLDKKEAQCPRCEESPTLKKATEKGVTVDFCPQCRGVWLDGGEILALRERSAANFLDFLKYISNELSAFRTAMRSRYWFLRYRI